MPEYFGAMSIGTDQIGPITSFGKEKPSGQAQGDDRDIVNEQDWQQRQQSARETGDHDAEPRETDVAGFFQNAIRQNSAEAVADHAGKEHAGRKQRRILDIQAVVVLKEER